MAPKKQKSKLQFYTVVFEKYIEVLEETGKFCLFLSDRIKELSNKIPINDWIDSEIVDFMEAFVETESFLMFLDEKINNPTDIELEFTLKNNVKDVLFDEQELACMQQSYIKMQSTKIILYKKYNFSADLN